MVLVMADRWCSNKKGLVKQVEYGERTRGEVLVSDSDIAEIYVNMEIRVVLKKLEEEWNLVYVLVKCLGRVGIENICFHVNILF